jgi:hypothetical protein
MKGVQIHLCSGAKGKTASFGKVTVVKLDRSPFEGAQVRTQRQAGPAGRALASIEDLALQSFKTSVHGLFSVKRKVDEFNKSREMLLSAIPAEAGIQFFYGLLDSRRSLPPRRRRRK